MQDRRAERDHAPVAEVLAMVALAQRRRGELVEARILGVAGADATMVHRVPGSKPERTAQPA